MRVNIDKYTGGVWIITTLNSVYTVNLNDYTLFVTDESSENVTLKDQKVHLIEFFADLGGTMNIAFKFPESEGIGRYVSQQITAITPVTA